MFNTRNSGKPVLLANNQHVAIPTEVSCVFKFGKGDQEDQFISLKSIDETEELYNCKKQADNMTLTMAAEKAAIESIKNKLKLSSSLQVHSFDGSLISVFNTEAGPLPSSSYTNLETSIDLPIGDSLFFDELLKDTGLDKELGNIDLEDELFNDFSNNSSSFASLVNFDPLMTIQELAPVPMEQTDPLSELPNVVHEETVSSINSPYSEDSAHDDIDHQKMKKSGGPVRKLARFGNKQVVKYSNEYHDRRIKNNEAVKKSRLKAKEKQNENEKQMQQLTEENRQLNTRVDLLMKELQLLRTLYKELKQDSSSSVAQGCKSTNAY